MPATTLSRPEPDGPQDEPALALDDELDEVDLDEEDDDYDLGDEGEDGEDAELDLDEEFDEHAAE